MLGGESLKYKYTAFFYPDDEEQECKVEIPALEIEYYVHPEQWTRGAVIKSAAKELSNTLYLYELDGIEIPANKTQGAPIGYEYTEELEADTAETASYSHIEWQVNFDDESE